VAADIEQLAESDRSTRPKKVSSNRLDSRHTPRLEDAGVEFIAAKGGKGVGVRLREG